MKKIAAALCLFSFSFMAHALECPKVYLACDHKVLGKNGSFGVINTKEVPFKGKECLAEVKFQSKQLNATFVVVAKETLETKLSIVNKNKDDVGSTFSIEAQANQFFTLTLGDEQILCIIN